MVCLNGEVPADPAAVTGSVPMMARIERLAQNEDVEGVEKGPTAVQREDVGIV